jgi:hypothetical protein
MSTIAIKSNPKLWEEVKNKIIKGSKGGPPGKISARKMQIAVAEYKARGGGYIGKKSPRNSLTKWSKEKWGYISPRGSKSKTGRYLPEKVRKMLTPREKEIENKRKGSHRGQWVPYSPSVTRKMHKAGVIKSVKSRKTSRNNSRKTSKKKSRK